MHTLTEMGKGNMIQCLPLYSILLAMGNPIVNYFRQGITVVKKMAVPNLDKQTFSYSTKIGIITREGSPKCYFVSCFKFFRSSIGKPRIFVIVMFIL
jgi:hypothetical protein